MVGCVTNVVAALTVAATAGSVLADSKSVWLRSSGKSPVKFFSVTMRTQSCAVRSHGSRVRPTGTANRDTTARAINGSLRDRPIMGSARLGTGRPMAASGTSAMSTKPNSKRSTRTRARLAAKSSCSAKRRSASGSSNNKQRHYKFLPCFVRATCARSTCLSPRLSCARPPRWRYPSAAHTGPSSRRRLAATHYSSPRASIVTVAAGILTLGNSRYASSPGCVDTVGTTGFLCPTPAPTPSSDGRSAGAPGRMHPSCVTVSGPVSARSISPGAAACRASSCRRGAASPTRAGRPRQAAGHARPPDRLQGDRATTKCPNIIRANPGSLQLATVQVHNLILPCWKLSPSV